MKPIETPRLLMTTWNPEDLPAAQELWGDPEVMRYVDAGGSLNPEQVSQKLQREIDRQQQFGVQYWKVILKESGEIIGCCGLQPYDLENRVCELGFHFMRRHWGLGYATEAARVVMAYAFQELRVPKLFAGHQPENLASAAVLTKLGFRRVNDRIYPPTGMYEPSYELESPSPIDD
jgi:ribosomal-protein-alanine N-acetyltransferase